MAVSALIDFYEIKNKISVKISKSHLVLKVKRTITNLTNPYFILPKFRTCFFSPFWSLKMIKKLSYRDYKESQLIWQIHISFYRRLERVSSVHFEALMMKKLSYRDYNKWIITRENGNVQSHDREESKLHSTINVSSGTHTLTHD